MDTLKQLVNKRIEKIRDEYVKLQSTKAQLQKQYDELKERETYLENAFNELMLLLEDIDNNVTISATDIKASEKTRIEG